MRLMTRVRRVIWMLVSRALALSSFVLFVTPAALADHHPLRTGLYMQTSDVQGDLAYARAAAAGTSIARISVRWASVVPAARPAQFDPRNPADPSYNWTALDQEVQ